MALYPRVHVWVNNEVLTASDLNAEFNNILNNSIASSIIGCSANVSAMQATVNPGGIGTESLAADVQGEIQRLRYMIQQLGGGAQWYVVPPHNLTSFSLVDADIASGAAIQRSKLAALVAAQGGSGGFTTSSTSFVDVTGYTITVTSTGAPFRICMLPDPSSATSLISANGPTSPVTNVELLRDGVVIGNFVVFQVDAAPVTIIDTIDLAPTAGSHTYKLQMKTNNGANNAQITSGSLYGYELS